MTCRLCPLGGIAITNCMPNKGTGSLLVVLSSPTSEEDLNGEYGSGIIGFLGEAGIKEEDVSLTSAIRCSLGGNRSLELSSTNSCRGHLRDTIHSVRPNKIIAFGNAALRATTKKSGIKEYRGKVLKLHSEFEYDCYVYPTYSLEELSRVPTYKRTIVADLRSVVKSDEVSDTVQFAFWSVT